MSDAANDIRQAFPVSRDPERASRVNSVKEAIEDLIERERHVLAGLPVPTLTEKLDITLARFADQIVVTAIEPMTSAEDAVVAVSVHFVLIETREPALVNFRL